MHTGALPTLSHDDIDDLLYFTRVNEVTDLQQTILELSQKYQCQAQDVLEACADPESGNTVLHFCSANGFADLLPGLLAQLSSRESSATTNGRAVSQLVNRGNREGNTPLHWAAYNGHLEIVKLLVTAGADMWVKNAAGHLAMFEAERADKSEVVQFLLEAGGKEVERTGAELPATSEEVNEAETVGESSAAQGAEHEDIEMDHRSSNG